MFFVVRCVQGDGFDFDAHVARLMEASARETGLRQRTADDDLQTKGLARVRRTGDEDSDSDDADAGSVGESEDASSGEFDEDLLEGLDINAGERGTGYEGVLREGTGERAALDTQFEAVSERFLLEGEGRGDAARIVTLHDTNGDVCSFYPVACSRRFFPV